MTASPEAASPEAASPEAASLSLDHLVRRFGAHTAVDDLSLEVTPGELVVLLGPSGCGKTTTLRLIAGFIAPNQGDIRLDGRSIVALPPYKRDMGIVFQSYALFPHLNVARNIAFGLEMRRGDAAATGARVQEMLRLVRLEAFAARLPRHLSGGQQQRVALARAVIHRPQLVLADEPTGNLDAQNGRMILSLLAELQEQFAVTVIMATHSEEAAERCPDRVVLDDGRIVELRGEVRGPQKSIAELLPQMKTDGHR
jgi:putative spermidine/putrescine transport system ATP-binding protein